MEDSKIKEAIEQVKVHCDMLMADYTGVSLRGALSTLGYSKEECDAVVLYCASKGFTNCIDPMVAVKSYPDFEPRYPTYDVCYWGPDQLKSRLQCLF